MVCEKRTYLKRLFYKADSKYIVSEAGSPEQGIKKSGKRTKNRIQDTEYLTSVIRLLNFDFRSIK
jgi:hypothetical protein